MLSEFIAKRFSGKKETALSGECLMMRELKQRIDLNQEERPLNQEALEYKKRMSCGDQSDYPFRWWGWPVN